MRGLSSRQTLIRLDQVDLRLWLPGQVIYIDESIAIPSHLAAGIYMLYMWLPDGYENLRSIPEYAIRLANEGIWQLETGFNLLTDNLEISPSP
jgi:hypothetical protein